MTCGPTRGLSLMGCDGLSFMGRPLPPAFALRLVTVPGGGRHPYRAAEWRGALVIVERGEVELEGLCGERRRLASGAMLWLDGLALRALHNPAAETLLLAAVWRRSDPRAPGPGAPGSRALSSGATNPDAPSPDAPSPGADDQAEGAR